MNIDELTPTQVKALQAQLTIIRAKGLANYKKGALLVDDITLNKGGGMTLRFKESGFPLNVTMAMVASIRDNIDTIEQVGKDIGCK